MGLNVNLTLKDRKILMVGGGQAAWLKLKKLAPEGAFVTVIAKEILGQVEELADHCMSRDYQEGDESEYFLVVCATDCQELNAAIAERCEKAGQLVLNCSGRGNIQMSAVQEVGELSIAVSGGGNPGFSRYLAQMLASHVDEDLLARYRLHSELREILIRKQDKHRNDKLREALTLDCESLRNRIEGEKMRIKIGTRGSRLAVYQTELVMSKLKEAHPGLDVSMKIIKTSGDLITDVPLSKMGDKGIFVKEIEEQLLSGVIDLSVNSMKDMPGELPAGLCLGPCPNSEDNRDALVTIHKCKGLEDLPSGGVIATGSVRRERQLLGIRPDLQVVGIRGNVETRIQKMLDQKLDGIILAMAGIKRLGLAEDERYQVLPIDPEQMLPSPCQGILALEMRQGDEKTAALLESLKDDKLELRAGLERDFLIHIHGGCHAPTGAHARIEKDRVHLSGLFGDNDRLVRKDMSARIGEHHNLAKELAASIEKELKHD
jgi:hydroxymethylbilane synthase